MPPDRDEKRFGKHPTQKPVALLERILLASSSPGDFVLDPFMGSGTTAVAALRNHRRFVGIEIDPRWVDVSLERLRDEMHGNHKLGRAQNGDRSAVIMPRRRSSECQVAQKQ